MVKILTNPVFMRMAVALVIAVLVMIAFVWIIRRMRRSLTADADVKPTRESSSNTDFTLAAAYQGVIQKYKEQEREAARLREEERQRAAATEKVNTAVLSQLSSGVLLFNRMQLVQQANPAAKTIFGFASPLGLHARDLFKGISAVRLAAGATGGAGSEALLEALQRCAVSGQGAQRLEADYVTPQGQKRVLGITLSAVRDSQGEGLGVACLASDLTEISELARQMRLRENLASLGEMSAGIAHEFKNSLATILGYAQMLRNEGNATVVSDFAGRIAEETSNLSRVVTDFLNFARPQDSDPEATAGTEPIQFRKLIEECSQPYDVDLRLEIPEQVEITGDQTAWRQAFANLVRNSAEAAKNGARVQVRISAHNAEGQLKIRVQDNGCGIPPEQLEKIFIPFFTTKDRGTGLGLALVHRIVTRHGGTIQASSSDQGTEFLLTLPAASQPGAQT